MKKALLVIILITLAVTLAGCGTPDPTISAETKETMCAPGFPSGWWHPECYGQDGGWALQEYSWNW